MLHSLKIYSERYQDFLCFARFFPRHTMLFTCSKPLPHTPAKAIRLSFVLADGLKPTLAYGSRVIGDSLPVALTPAAFLLFLSDNDILPQTFGDFCSSYPQSRADTGESFSVLLSKVSWIANRVHSLCLLVHRHGYDFILITKVWPTHDIPESDIGLIICKGFEEEWMNKHNRDRLVNAREPLSASW